MKMMLLITAFSLISGMNLLFLQHSTSKKIETEQEQFAENINLALRQTANNLYLIEKDSTSTISPVKDISSHQFSIELGINLNYDTLPYILDQAFLDNNIEGRYNVTIKKCNEAKILLGYNSLAFENRKVACIGRNKSSNCNILNVTFLDRVEAKMNYIIPIILSFLIFFGSIIYMKLLTKKVKNQATNDYVPDGQIVLGNSSFTPIKLSIEVNGLEKTLTFRESKLLECFFNKPNQILKRDDIKEEVWGEEGIMVGRSVDVFVSRLRKILTDDELLKIKTIHGVGYQLMVNKG